MNGQKQTWKKKQTNKKNDPFPFGLLSFEVCSTVWTPTPPLTAEVVAWGRRTTRSASMLACLGRGRTVCLFFFLNVFLVLVGKVEKG